MLGQYILIFVADLVNKWKMKERADGVQTRHAMYVHYSKMEHLLGTFVTYIGQCKAKKTKEKKKGSPHLQINDMRNTRGCRFNGFFYGR